LLLGRAVFWPLRDDSARGAPTGRGWSRVAELVTTRPKKVIGVTVAGLALLSTGLLGYQQSFDFVSGFRIDTESAEGQSLLREHFAPGEVAPSALLIRSDQDLAGEQRALQQISGAVAGHDGVARVDDVPRISSDGRVATYD